MEAVFLLKLGVSSALVTVIWLFLWLGAGALLVIMGLDFGLRVRGFLGQFDGWRAAATTASIAGILVVLRGLEVVGLLPFATVAVGFALCALVLAIIGTIGGAPLPKWSWAVSHRFRRGFQAQAGCIWTAFYNESRGRWSGERHNSAMGTPGLLAPAVPPDASMSLDRPRQRDR